MKALTIIQPWATLIASGHKMNETRSWKTNYRGEVLTRISKNSPTSIGGEMNCHLLHSAIVGM